MPCLSVPSQGKRRGPAFQENAGPHSDSITAVRRLLRHGAADAFTRVADARPCGAAVATLGTSALAIRAFPAGIVGTAGRLRRRGHRRTAGGQQSVGGVRGIIQRTSPALTTGLHCTGRRRLRPLAAGTRAVVADTHAGGAAIATGHAARAVIATQLATTRSTTTGLHIRRSRCRQDQSHQRHASEHEKAQQFGHEKFLRANTISE